MNPSLAHVVVHACLRSEDELAPSADPEGLVHDAATRMFWRNVAARSGGAPVNRLGRKPQRYDVPEGVEVPPVSALVPVVGLRALLLLPY